MFNQVRKPYMPNPNKPRMPRVYDPNEREIIGYTEPINRGRPIPTKGPRLMVEGYYDEPPRPIYKPKPFLERFKPIDSTNPVRPPTEIKPFRPIRPISVFNPSLEGKVMPYTEAIHSDLGRKDTSSTAVGLVPSRQVLQSQARLPTAMPSSEPIQRQTNFNINN